MVSNCYYALFNGCRSLNFIRTEQTSFTGCTNWAASTAASGTFVCSSTLGTQSTISRGASACPSSWTVSNGMWWGFYVQAKEAGATVAMQSSMYS